MLLRWCQLWLAMAGSAALLVRRQDMPSYQLSIDGLNRSPIAAVEPVHQSSGYLNIDETRHMYFSFFEARTSPLDAPLVIWLGGGPSCSAMDDLFFQNGPAKVQSDLSLRRNPFSWNTNANVLYVDQPGNVGFSSARVDPSSMQAAADFFSFLTLFLHQFPSYKNRPIHLAGESYAGHFIPACTTYVLSRPEREFNISSIIIGSGIVDPRAQLPEVHKTLCEGPTTIPGATPDMCRRMKATLPRCQSYIDDCYQDTRSSSCSLGALYCQSTQVRPIIKGNINLYDLRLSCQESSSGLCYKELDLITQYLSQPTVQEGLAANGNLTFANCDSAGKHRYLFNGDWLQPYGSLINFLLEQGVRTLVYSGDSDLLAGWEGTNKWTQQLDWSRTHGFSDAPLRPWYGPNGQAGQVRSMGALTALKVFDSGHMVSHDQPEVSLEFLNQWLAGNYMLRPMSAMRPIVKARPMLRAPGVPVNKQFDPNGWISTTMTEYRRRTLLLKDQSTLLLEIGQQSGDNTVIAGATVVGLGPGKHPVVTETQTETIIAKDTARATPPVTTVFLTHVVTETQVQVQVKVSNSVRTKLVTKTETHSHAHVHQAPVQVNVNVPAGYAPAQPERTVTVGFSANAPAVTVTTVVPHHEILTPALRVSDSSDVVPAPSGLHHPHVSHSSESASKHHSTYPLVLPPPGLTARPKTTVTVVVPPSRSEPVSGGFGSHPGLPVVTKKMTVTELVIGGKPSTGARLPQTTLLLPRPLSQPTVNGTRPQFLGNGSDPRLRIHDEGVAGIEHMNDHPRHNRSHHHHHHSHHHSYLQSHSSYRHSHTHTYKNIGLNTAVLVGHQAAADTYNPEANAPIRIPPNSENAHSGDDEDVTSSSIKFNGYDTFANGETGKLPSKAVVATVPDTVSSAVSPSVARPASSVPSAASGVPVSPSRSASDDDLDGGDDSAPATGAAPAGCADDDEDDDDEDDDDVGGGRRRIFGCCSGLLSGARDRGTEAIARLNDVGRLSNLLNNIGDATQLDIDDDGDDGGDDDDDDDGDDTGGGRLPFKCCPRRRFGLSEALASDPILDDDDDDDDDDIVGYGKMSGGLQSVTGALAQAEGGLQAEAAQATSAADSAVKGAAFKVEGELTGSGGSGVSRALRNTVLDARYGTSDALGATRENLRSVRTAVGTSGRAQLSRGKGRVKSSVRGRGRGRTRGQLRGLLSGARQRWRDAKELLGGSSPDWDEHEDNYDDYDYGYDYDDAEDEGADADGDIDADGGDEGDDDSDE